VSTSTSSGFTRRARPLLGTLVEVGCDGGDVQAAFDAVAAVQACMSRFDARSDIGRFNAMDAGAIEVDAQTAFVLDCAARLQAATGGVFDISLGSGTPGWRLDGRVLHKLQPGTALDLGGIAKGHAVDRALAALRASGATRGWVNAGGDLAVFGDLALPLRLRDEARGGVRDLGHLSDGAAATSAYGPGRRSQLVLVTAVSGRDASQAHAPAHVTVLASSCLWADALTKVCAAGLGRAALAALLDAHGAQAWRH
jgi:thiamine biosynthesis lipoprotein